MNKFLLVCNEKLVSNCSTLKGPQIFKWKTTGLFSNWGCAPSLLPTLFASARSSLIHWSTTMECFSFFWAFLNLVRVVRIFLRLSTLLSTSSYGCSIRDKSGQHRGHSSGKMLWLARKLRQTMAAWSWAFSLQMGRGLYPCTLLLFFFLARYHNQLWFYTMKNASQDRP